MSYFKSKALKILLVLVVVVLIIFLFVAGLLSPSSDTETQERKVTLSEGASFDNLIPGESTISDALEILGEPINDKGSTTLEFNSTNPNLGHKIITDEDKIIFIKEIVAPKDEKTVKDITDVYGDARYVLYGPESIHGFNLYIYPNKGIAYIGHINEPILLEVWYFQPTTFEDFRKKWASGYSDSPQVAQ